jgi:hypothetical protein
MIRASSPLKPVLAGLLLTLAQMALAILLLAPEGPLPYRYSTLIQHDAYWFMNIVNRGYQTTVPPINHKVVEVSNVAFFPAYPAAATLELFLPFLRTLESFADDAFFWRTGYRRTSGRLLSDCGLLRVTFSDGAGGIYLLEQH